MTRPTSSTRNLLETHHPTGYALKLRLFETCHLDSAVFRFLPTEMADDEGGGAR